MSTTNCTLRKPTPSRRLRSIVILLLTTVLLSACATDSGTATPGAAAAATEGSSHEDVFLDASSIHEISVDFDQTDYDTMIETYTSTGEKDWIVATVTIDGVTYEQAGIRLKGNSSLRGLGGAGGFGERPGGNRAEDPAGEASSDNPESLPWLIRLDKFVDGQNHEGIYDLVVRSNNSESALNEAVALDLLEAAGLASQEAAYAAFSVNGSEEVLRLVIEHPDDVWLEANFADSGLLYKAESTGDYSYRGDDPDSYDEVFDLEAGGENGDLTPLIEFLDFINNSDDGTFNGELADHLDIDSFATYLAAQELIANFDDIDGRGNNSYLYYNTETQSFTVVPWDHNLAFGGFGGGDRGELAGAEGFTPPDGFDIPGEFTSPEGFAPPEGFDPNAPEGVPGPPRAGDFAPPDGAVGGRGAGGGPTGSNVLVERFLANEDWQELYEEKLESLRGSLYENETASEILTTWTQLLLDDAGDLIDGSAVTDEAEAIAEFFS